VLWNLLTEISAASGNLAHKFFSEEFSSTKHSSNLPFPPLWRHSCCIHVHIKYREWRYSWFLAFFGWNSSYSYLGNLWLNCPVSLLFVTITLVVWSSEKNLLVTLGGNGQPVSVAPEQWLQWWVELDEISLNLGPPAAIYSRSQSIEGWESVHRTTYHGRSATEGS